MAKKSLATLINTSGIKYAKLIRAVKSRRTGSYKFKEEMVIEEHVKDILAGKDPQELIEALRAKQSAARVPAKEEAPAKEEVKSEEVSAKEEAPTKEEVKPNE